MLTIADLDPSQRQAWKTFFDYYVFRLDQDPSQHLPNDLEDIVTHPSEEQLNWLRESLARKLDS